MIGRVHHTEELPMPSPFPGMNPYLEQDGVWCDFHLTFVVSLRSALAGVVGQNYFASVKQRTSLWPADESGTSPKLLKVKVNYLEVVDTRDEKVVTVIELLSPSNKYAGDDRESYLTKRRELLGTRVNFVELDFLRGGPRPPLKGLPACAYYAMVSRPPARPEADIWPIKLREPLPTLPIPLRGGENEASVDLMAVLHRVYDGAGYARRIYRTEPEPRLSPEDEAWAKELIAAAPSA